MGGWKEEGIVLCKMEKNGCGWEEKGREELMHIKGGGKREELRHNGRKGRDCCTAWFTKSQEHHTLFTHEEVSYMVSCKHVFERSGHKCVRGFVFSNCTNKLHFVLFLESILRSVAWN